MKSADVLENALREDNHLAAFWSHSPKAFILPFQKSESDEYVIVWLYIKKELITLDVVWKVSCAAVTTALELKVLAGKKGIEIVPCVMDEKTGTDRIVRLSVYTEAIDQFLRLSPKDILPSHPGVGILSGWYWNPGSLAASLGVV